MMEKTFGFLSGDKEIEQLAASRMRICKKCPLYKLKWYIIPVCNNKLYMNPDTKDVSTSEKKGYIRGCGCNLEYRTMNPKMHCLCKRW